MPNKGIRIARGVGIRRAAMLLSLCLFTTVTGAQATPASASAASSATSTSKLWYEVTVGGTGMRLTCDLCQPARDLGPTITASVGANASARVRVGLELSRWTYKNEAAREQMHGLGVVAHLTPDPRRGLYLLAGFGWAGYRAGDFSYDAPRVTLGAGWDVAAFGRWTIGSAVALDAAAFAPLKNGNVTVMRSVGLSALRVSVQLRRGGSS